MQVIDAEQATTEEESWHLTHHQDYKAKSEKTRTLASSSAFLEPTDETLFVRLEEDPQDGQTAVRSGLATKIYQKLDGRTLSLGLSTVRQVKPATPSRKS